MRISDWSSDVCSSDLVFKPEGDVEGMLIYHHGAGETIDELVELQSRSTSLVGHLLEEGWAVAATAAGGDHWGSQAGIDANTALWEALDDDLRVDSGVLLGHSIDRKSVVEGERGSLRV